MPEDALPEESSAPDAVTTELPIPEEAHAESPEEAEDPEEPDEPREEPAATAASDACDTLIALYEALEQRLRESDTESVGWRPQLAALRAMRDGQVAGDREELARLLVAPEDSDVIWDGSVNEVVQEVVGASERALVLAPTEGRAEEIARAAGEDVFALLVTAAPGAPEVTQEEPDVTREEASAPEGEPERPAPPLREDGSIRTVEFRPPTSADLTRPQEVREAPDVGVAGRTPVTEPPAESAEPADGTTSPVPALDDRAPGTRVSSVIVRPIGEAWRKSWTTEAQMLQRGLMWLEQWPRDMATLDALKTAKERRREELNAELAGLGTRVEEMRAAVEVAEQAATRAGEEAERLETVQAQIAAELEGPRGEAQRLQAEADSAANEAGGLTRTAEATLARCNALDQRNAQARAELQAAQQEEEALTADLAKARQDLPRVAQEADRLLVESAAAEAEGHTRYYRLAAAESALAARRRNLSLGQRLHVAPPPTELKELRAQVKAMSREADGAAERMTRLKEDADRAHAYRTQLEAFLDEGGTRLVSVQKAQQQLAAELGRLAQERTSATADHQEKAHRAAEAVNRATQASAIAVNAQRVAQEIEGRLAVARREQEAAKAAHEHARAETEAAGARLAETEALLSRRRVEVEEESSARSGEFEAAMEAEARSRQNVEEITGGGPLDQELLAEHRHRSMARIEQLRAHLDRAENGFNATTGIDASTSTDARDETGDVLLRTADLVCGTPLTVGVTGPDAEFDVLVVAGAGALNEADFLIGAVRARRWVLLGVPDETPPAYPEYEGHADGERLARSPFGGTRPAA